MSTLSDFVVVDAGNFPALLRDWREDTVTFLHHDMPKLVIIVVGALVLSRLLRDEDGTVHFVPSSGIRSVSNTTRDWSQLTLRVTVAYSEPSDRIVKLLQEIGDEVRHAPAYAEEIVSDIEVPGIDRVGNGEAEYLMLVKTRPNKQYAVSRELRRRIKDCFHKQNVQTPGPGRMYVVDQDRAS